MLLNNLRFSERVKLNLVSKLFPVKSADILLLDKIEIDLKETNVTQVNVPPLALPQITDDFSLANTESEEFNTKPSYTQIINCNNNNCRQLLRLNIYEQIIGSQLSVTCPTCRKTFLYAPTGDELIADFTAWLKEQLFYPDIKSFSMLLDKPRNAGKAYRQSTEKEQSSLFDTEDDDKDCIHGLKKSWCSICTQKEKHKKETASSQVDLFDLIFPILQPPLGENFDSPIAFPYDLYPFQRNGVKFLAENERALLADEMGLGKSIQTIVAIRFLFRKGDITNGLILCPKSLLTDWEKKLWDWAPEIRVVKVRGTKEQRQISWNTPSHLYLTTYETLRQDISNSLGNSESEDVAKKEFDIAILDEIQKIKNPSADVTKVTRQLIARRSWGLSGTPLENRVEELISIFAYLKPGLLHYDDAARPLKVKEAIKPYFLRRRKVDVLDDLPAKYFDLCG